MKRNTILIILLFILNSGFSQTVFYGKISDSKQQVLPYSNIYLKKNRIGTSSSTKGHYKFKVEDVKYKYDTLIVSFLGYETKRIPVILGGNQKQDIVLNPTQEKIKSVRVDAEKPKYTAQQIIKKARNKVRKNYIKQTVVQEGFYRETLKENGITLKINECALDFKSSGYPKAKFSRKSFIDQNDDLWDNNLVVYGFSDFAQHWPLYISTDEKVNVTKSRMSIDRSSIDGKYKRLGDPHGGPIDIIGLNNIKYKLDFFNPKLTKQYTYKIVDIKYIDSNLCYVIDYSLKYPFRYQYFHQYNKKVKRPLFKGEIVVRKKDFSIMSFSSKSVNWYNCLSVMDKTSKTFLTFNPNRISFHVDFQETGLGLILKSIQYEANYNSVLENNSNYKWFREIVLSKSKDKVFEENTIEYFPTRQRTLRNRVTSYDSEFWKTFETSSLFIPLSKREKEDLEEDIPLTDQFELINQSVAEIPKPKFEGKYAQIFESNKDLPIDSVLFNHYIEDEDLYANTVFQKLNDFEREFQPGWILNKDYDATPTNPKKKPQFFKQLDSTRTTFIYENINDTTAKPIFNLSYESTNNKSGQIYYFDFSKHYVFIDIKDVKQLSHTLKIKRKANIHTIDSISNVNEFLLINDSTIVYTTFNSNRPSSLYLHHVGHSPKEDILLYYEANVEYDIELSETSSEAYIIVDITSKDQNEICVINKEDLQFSLVYKRQYRAQLKLDHFTGDQHFTSLVSSKNYSIIKTNTSSLLSDTLIQTESIIHDFYLYHNQLVYTEYDTFDMRMIQFDVDEQTSNYIELQKGFSYIEFNKNKKTQDSLNVYIESPIQPTQEFKINVNTGKYKLIDENKYSYSHHKSNYQSEVIYVKSDDGIEIPVLIYYDKKAISDSVTALLIKSYGAYGGINVVGFDRLDITLLKKGFIIAEPAVRGGAIYGQDWYFDGKLLNKKHTFDDFITVTRQLKEKYKLPPKRTFAKGTSAGGLIMGVMANDYSDEFGGIILDRPFLDVSNSMMDSTKFLTTAEYQEWGNPKDSLVNAYIKSYSPFQNIKKQAYTNLLFRPSEYDFITPLDQITKSVLKIRENNSSKNLVLMNLYKNQGHFIRHSNQAYAQEYAFMMYIINKENVIK